MSMTTPCVLWTGHITASGYGRFGPRPAHCVLWLQARGPIPAGMQLDHLCGVRSCVNLDHLEVVTHAENMRRARKTHCRKGHPREGNTYWDRLGKPHCRICHAATERARLRRIK